MRDCTAFSGVMLCQFVPPRLTTIRWMPVKVLSIVSVVGLAVARLGFPASRCQRFVLRLQCLAHRELDQAQDPQADGEEADEALDAGCCFSS